MKREKGLVVYAGSGSSHSWTWLADLLDTVHDARVVVVDETELSEALSGGCSTLVVSGGDAFQIARSFSDGRFKTVERFVRSGGLYVGICAGAYLPLPSSVPPLDEFNISTTKIENILTEFHGVQEPSERICLRYCDRTIVHPVRGDVSLDIGGGVIAPLYGGPIFKEPTTDEIAFRYSGLTEQSEFNILSEEATSMIVGKPAAIRSHLGHGTLLLIGPHLEHPGYPRANALFLSLLGIDASASSTRVDAGFDSARIDPQLRGALADLKVAISGLESRSFLVGRKLWDAERLQVLLKAVESRATSISVSESPSIVSDLRRARAILVSPDDANDAFEDALRALMSAARIAVNLRFQRARTSDDFIRIHHDSIKNE